jgi:transposase
MVRFEVPMDTEQRLKELERRRLRGARLLNNGTHPAEVARQVGVSRQSVMRWERALKENGVQGLERAEAPGRPRRLSEAQLKELAKVLKAGSLAAGYATEMWTLPRIGALIQERFGVKFAQSSVWRTLQKMGWSPQRPARQARQRDEAAIRTWKNKRWPELKK